MNIRHKIFRSGFTLIELLVVISIIALLLGILLPSLSSARKRAWEVICTTNMRTLSFANRIYAEENHDQYVAVVIPDNIAWFQNPQYKDIIALKGRGTEGTESWTMPEEYNCPADKRNVDMTDPINRGIMGYGLNATGWDIVKTPYLTHKSTEIVAPFRKIMFIDAQCWSVRSNGADYRKYWDIYGEIEGYFTPEGENLHGLLAYRHREGANVAFFDNHVEYLTKEEVYPVSRDPRETDNKVRQLWEIRPGLPYP